MIFKIFTAMILIAELIIAYTLITKLIVVDKLILNADETIMEINPSVKDVCVLIKKISFQYVEFAKEFVSKINDTQEDVTISILNKVLISLLLIKLNLKFINKLRRSKVIKRINRGLSLLKYVV